MMRFSQRAWSRFPYSPRHHRSQGDLDRKHRLSPFLAALAILVPAELRADPPQFVYADYGVLCTPGALRACSSIQIQAQRDPVTGQADVYLWVSNMEGQFFRSNTVNSLISQVNLYSLIERPLNGIEFSPFPCIDLMCVFRYETPFTANFVTPESGVGVYGNPWVTASGLKGGPRRNFPFEIESAGVAGCGALPGVADYYQTCGARVRLNFTGYGGEIAAGPQFPNAFVDELAMGSIGVSVEFGEDLHCGSALDYHSFYKADILCESFPSTVTPEPGTLILVGTGVAGMMGVARRRRRRQRALRAEND